MPDDCIFCKIASGETPTEKIIDEDNFFSILNKDPQLEGHSLIISKKHFETVLDMPNSLGPEFLDCAKKTASKLMEKYNAEGFNLANNIFEVAGQSIKHFHFHILPRKKGDGYSLALGGKGSL